MTIERLQAENQDLRRRLEEAEETIRAIQSGAVDAFVIEESAGRQVYTLETVDRPYRLFVEEMQQGAATLLANGTIVYCNRRLADMLMMPHEKLAGAALHDFIAADDRTVYDDLLCQGQTRSGRGEARLRRTDGGLVPVYVTFNALPQACGAAIGVLITDLTNQRQHEQLTAAHKALRESEEKLRAFAGQLELLVDERATELMQSQDRLRALATELNLSEQRERDQLATELHDHLQQILVLGKLKLG